MSNTPARRSKRSPVAYVAWKRAGPSIPKANPAVFRETASPRDPRCPVVDDRRRHGASLQPRCHWPQGRPPCQRDLRRRRQRRHRRAQHRSYPKGHNSRRRPNPPSAKLPTRRSRTTSRPNNGRARSTNGSAHGRCLRSHRQRGTRMRRPRRRTVTRPCGRGPSRLAASSPVAFPARRAGASEVTSRPWWRNA